MTPDKCLFCDMYGEWKREEGKIIYHDKNDTIYAILSVTPVNSGHTVLIPRRHIERYEEMTPYEARVFLTSAGPVLKSLQALYDTDPERIADFYKRLKENPPKGGNAEMAAKVLKDKDLRERPLDWDHTLGINVGKYAGQSLKHIHGQLSPSREEPRPGIVTAMYLLMEQERAKWAEKEL